MTSVATASDPVVSTRRWLAILIALAAIVVALYPRPAAAQAPVADYMLQNNFDSSLSGPPLQELGGATGAFATETVGGANRVVYTYPAGNGLSLPDTSTVTANDVYSIAVLLRLENVQGYRRLIDFKDGTSDAGLYNYDGTLHFYPGIGGTDVVINLNTWAQVAITRDAAGNVNGFVNGVQQFSFVDDGQRAVIGPGNVLNFFQDDVAVGGEHSSGAVARIRVWNQALTPDQVSALDDNQPFVDPSPSPTQQPEPVRVEANVSFKITDNYFAGFVRPESDSTQGFDRQKSFAAMCDNRRRVKIKQQEPGRDPVIGRDRSNYRGYYRVREPPDGGEVYYSVVRRKRIRLDGGGKVVCARAESRHLRAPRQ